MTRDTVNPSEISLVAGPLHAGGGMA